MKIIRFSSSYQEPYPLLVFGESFYHHELEEVSGYMGEEEGVNADDFKAHLILDNRNYEDPGNAVAIEINGKTVGHLSKSNAKIYRKRIIELGLGDVVGECYASIRGGHIKRDGEQAEFGVRLDLDLDTFTVYKPPEPKPQPVSVVSEIKSPVEVSGSPSKKEPKRKIPFIPMNGKGALYVLFVLPFILALNFIILIVAGILLGGEWVIKRLSNLKSNH